MKIILLQDVKNLGKKYDIKEVSDGYARNFLLPKKLAEIATARVIKELNLRGETLKNKKSELDKALEKTAEELKNKEFNFYVEAEGEKTFGSVQKDNIKNEVEKFLHFLPEDLKRQIIGKIKIKLEKPLKTLGTHSVSVKLPNNIEFKIAVTVNRIAL